MCLNNYLDRLNWKNVLSFIVYGAENEDEEETMLKSNLLKRISDYEKNVVRILQSLPILFFSRKNYLKQ